MSGFASESISSSSIYVGASVSALGSTGGMTGPSSAINMMSGSSLNIGYGATSHVSLNDTGLLAGAFDINTGPLTFGSSGGSTGQVVGYDSVTHGAKWVTLVPDIPVLNGTVSTPGLTGIVMVPGLLNTSHVILTPLCSSGTVSSVVSNVGTDQFTYTLSTTANVQGLMWMAIG